MLDNYTFTLFKNGKSYNVTKMIGGVSRKSSESLLGEEVSFSKAQSLDAYFPKLKFDVGDGFVITDSSEEIFRGIIVDESQSGLTQFSYTAFDYAFYLNKSKTIFQGNGIRADEAIIKLCSKFSIPMGSIANIKTPINQIFKDETISEIIKKILESAEADLGIKFRFEMDKGKFVVMPMKKMIVKATYKPAPNIAAFDSTLLIGSFNRTRSISDMINSIIIVSDQENATSVVAHEKDDINIKKYGLLETIEKVNEKDIAQARNIAKNKLKELNRVIESNSIELLGDDRVKAGRILEINEPLTGLKGYYLVKECTHAYSTFHKMQLTLGEVTESVLSTKDIQALSSNKLASTSKSSRTVAFFDDGKNMWQ